MISASGKALIDQLLAKHQEQCEREAALCGALLNGGTGKHKRAAIVKSANTIRKAGTGKGSGQPYGPHNPHWTQTPAGRKRMSKQVRAQIKRKRERTE